MANDQDIKKVAHNAPTSGGGIYARDIFGPDFVVIHEMAARDDYGLNRIRFVHPQPIILDLGANIGAFSIIAAVRFPSAKILAYEPEEQNFKTLLKNIELNKLQTRVMPHKMAIADRAGNGQLFLSTLEYGHSLFIEQLGDGREYGDVKTAAVQCTTVSGIMENYQHIDLIKMDIEGSEYEVLYNLPAEKYKKISYIVLEIHDHDKYNRKDLISFLKNKQFEVVQSLINSNVFFVKNLNLIAS